MAKMIPAQFSTSKARGLDEKPGDRAEIQVYSELQELPNSFTCVHSYRLASRELDFIIIHPQLPLIFLEVKGGILVQKDGRIYLENRKTRELHEKSPIEQLYSAHSEFIRALTSRGALNQSPKTLPYVFFAVFPDSQLPHQLLPQLEGAAIFGNQLNSAELNKIFLSQEPRFGKLGTETASELIQFLGREIRSQPAVLIEKIFALEEKIIDGTNQSVQLYLDTILANPQFIVEGSAGTGKTILLIELANSLSKKGEGVLITCYNELIEDLLHRHFSENPNVQVKSFHRLCEEVITQAKGHDFVKEYKLTIKDELRKADYYSKWLPNQLNESVALLAARAKSISFATILIDEAQDFEPDWLLSLRELLQSNTSRIGLFTDPIQNIQRNQTNAEAAFINQPTRILLRYNIRNTKQICAFSSPFYLKAGEELGMPLKPLCSPTDFPEGKKPEVITVSSEANCLQELSSLLHNLIVREQIPMTRITILTSLARDLILSGKQTISHGRPVGPYKFAPESNSAEKTLQLETIRRFKGRENLVIIALEYSDLKPKLRYVTYSRALARLYVFRIQE